ncbi:unnamed protein product [Ectocarpus sp. 4 AP-2014]
MDFVDSHAGSPATRPIAVCSRPRTTTARRIRPRSAAPPPPRVGGGGDGREACRQVYLKQAGGGGGAFSPAWTGGVSIPASGLSMSTALLLSLLAVSGAAAPAAAAAAAAAVAAAAAAPQSPPTTAPSPFSSTAFCSASPPPPLRVCVGVPSAWRPASIRRLRRRSNASSAARSTAGRSRAPSALCSRRNSISCSWSTGTPPPPTPSLLWKGRRARSYGGGRCLSAEGLLPPRSRLRSRAEIGLTDDWSTGEASHRPEDGGAGWNCEWDDDMDLLTSFGFDGYGGSGSYGDGSGPADTDASTGDDAPSLAERDAARLEEVGIMVEELEGSRGGSTAAGATAAVVGTARSVAAGDPSPSAPPAAARDDADIKELTRTARKGDLTGGAMDSARLRMTCGDPVFFAHLAELMQGVHRQSGGRKFLNHEEEMELGETVQRYRGLIEAQEKAEKNSGRRPRLRDVARSAGLSEEAFASIMQAGMEARQKLVVCNLALVVSLANKYKRSHFDCGCLQTLIQEGTIGLIRAAERYDPSKGFRFTTYAIWWIEARLRVSVQTEERFIHVPMWVKNQYNTVHRSVPKLRKSLGREPTSEELAAQVEIDTNSKVVVTPKRVEELETWVSFHRKHESLDVPLEVSTPLPADCSTIEDGVKAPDLSTESTSELEIQRDFLESCLCQDLSKIQRKILRMKVGLGGEKGKNRQEISRALKMPFNNVISEERKAFYKLRGLQRGGGYPSFEELK